MNAENIVTALEKFFFEIIGQLLPGLLLLSGLYYVLPDQIVSDFYPSTKLGNWILIGAAYVIGGALTALGSYFFIPLFLWVFNLKVISWVLPTKVKKRLITNDEIDNKIIASKSYQHIRTHLPEGSTLETVRNVAMTSIDQTDKETTIRFMFLSLLSQGIATALLLVAISKLVVEMSIYSTFSEGVLNSVLIVFLTAIVSLPFVLREREFFDRARRLPLDAYLAALKSSEFTDEK